MTDEKTGGPAFPMLDVDGGTAWQGMTLRDYFAAKAMQVFLTNERTTRSVDASASYEMADAMMEARK